VPSEFPACPSSSDVEFVLSQIGDIEKFRGVDGPISAVDAINAALLRYANKAQPTFWALWDLWSQIASRVSYESESVGEGAYSKSTARTTAADWYAKATAADAAAQLQPAAGVFTSIPIERC
jgi:hypothetical protein